MATEGKTDHMTDNKKQIHEAKEKLYQTAQTAKDQTTKSKDQTASYFSEKTGATKDKSSVVAQSAQAEKDKSSEVAQAEKDKTAGGLGNTAEQVKSVAAGTMEAVKQKLGMGTKDDNN